MLDDAEGVAPERKTKAVAALSAAGSAIDRRGQDGKTPLWLAAFGCDLSVAQALLDAEALVDAASSEGAPPGFIASQKGGGGGEAASRTRSGREDGEHVRDGGVHRRMAEATDWSSQSDSVLIARQRTKTRDGQPPRAQPGTGRWAGRNAPSQQQLQLPGFAAQVVSFDEALADCLCSISPGTSGVDTETRTP
jgi:hypothetical protein